MDSSKIDIGLAKWLRIDGLVMDWQIRQELALDRCQISDECWIGQGLSDWHWTGGLAD